VSGVGETFARTVTDGPLLVAGAVAALAGLVSFLSPCVLPLVPGYLSYVAGLSGSSSPDPAPGAGGAVATQVRTGRGRVVAGAALFVLGFTAVFVAYGVLFGRLGALLFSHQRLLERVLGAVVVLLGLSFLGVLRGVPGLQRDLRIHRLPATGLAGAPVLGVVFGLGWTPCLGPTLGAVQSLALSTAGAGRGAALSAAYCLGLGVPFLLVALGARWAVDGIAVVRRHAAVVTWVGGALLVLIGLLLLTGAWGALMTDLRSWAGSTGIGTSL
jgi:cytochrome c-type biogenesis protein